MTKNINDAISLTSYFITLPPSRFIVTGIFLIGIVFGFLFNVDSVEFSQNFVLNCIIDGFVLLIAPALLSSIVIKVLVRKMPYRRIAATALAGETVYAIAYLASILLSNVNLFWAQLVILIGAAIVFVFWYVIARFIFILKYRSILFAIIQLLFYLMFLLSDQALYTTNAPFWDVAVKFYISSFVLLGALAIFIFIVNAPMKKNLGISSTDTISYLFGAWLYHNKDLEKSFEQVGEDAKTILSIAGFKRKNDTVYFVTPYVHFGPFGNLGGSEFSYLIADEMDKKYQSKTFVFHGTVTHDLNPVATSEMKNIMKAVDESIGNAVYKNAKVSISLGKNDECKAQALRINNSAIVSLSRAPHVTEDVNFGLGLALISEAEKYSDKAMMIDQHNAETGDITSFEPGSPIAFGYLEAVRDSFSKTADQKPLKIGVATRSIDSSSIGKAGIKVAVFSSSPEYVMILIDCNGVTPEFRDEIESAIIKLGKNKNRKFTVGIFTTDTHQTNMVKGVLNPLKEQETALKLIEEACEEALEDMQEAKFFIDKKWFDIKIIGAKQSIEVISTINSIVAISKITFPLILLGGILLVIAIVSSM
jgi:putative membrane protein